MSVEAKDFLVGFLETIFMVAPCLHLYLTFRKGYDLTPRYIATVITFYVLLGIFVLGGITVGWQNSHMNLPDLPKR